MNDSDTVAAERLDLGRQLAARRKQAGYLQRELAYLMGYSRTAIANAETAATRPSHNFWTDADRVLGTGELFARGHKRIVAQMAAESRKPGARDTPTVVRDEPARAAALSRRRRTGHARLTWTRAGPSRRTPRDGYGLSPAP